MRKTEKRRWEFHQHTVIFKKTPRGSLSRVRVCEGILKQIHNNRVVDSKDHCEKDTSKQANKQTNNQKDIIIIIVIRYDGLYSDFLLRVAAECVLHIAEQ
jgi:hypothetical protein